MDVVATFASMHVDGLNMICSALKSQPGTHVVTFVKEKQLARYCRDGVNRHYAINNLTLPLSAAQFVFAWQVHSRHSSQHSFNYALSIVQPEMLRIVETTASLRFACRRDFPTSAVRQCHVVISPRSQRKTNIKALGSFGRLEAVESFHGVGRDHTSTLAAGR